MKVGILGPIAWRTPPRSYGPWERVAGLIASGLHERGVDVTLFATLDSETPAKLDGVCPAPYAEDPSMDGRVWEALHVAHAFGRSGEFDVVHNHLDWLPLAFEHLAHAPLVTTIHGFSGPTIMPVRPAPLRLPGRAGGSTGNISMPGTLPSFCCAWGRSWKAVSLR